MPPISRDEYYGDMLEGLALANPDTLTDTGHDADALRHWKACLQAESQRDRAAYARRQMV